MVMDAIFGFLVPLTPPVSVLIFAIIILVIINIFYKILINQKEAKEIKERSKALQEEYKKEQKAGNTEKASKLMSESLKEQSKMMRMSLKPMIISLVIVALLLPWLNGIYGDIGLEDNTETQTFDHAGKEFQAKIEDSSITINDDSCETPCTIETDGAVFEVSMNEAVTIAPVVAKLPIALPVVGDSAGWLAWYIISSMPFALVTRKLMKINI